MTEDAAGQDGPIYEDKTSGKWTAIRQAQWLTQYVQVHAAWGSSAASRTQWPSDRRGEGRFQGCMRAADSVGAEGTGKGISGDFTPVCPPLLGEGIADITRPTAAVIGSSLRLRSLFHSRPS
jgi:hypothetical protein